MAVLAGFIFLLRRHTKVYIPCRALATASDILDLDKMLALAAFGAISFF
jgi:hypothetical protein